MAESVLSRLQLFYVTSAEVGSGAMGALEQLAGRVYEEIYPLAEGAVILATCNRFEVYADSEAPEDAWRAVSRVIGGYSGAFKRLSGREAVIHLFRVASGLESPVIGESEVLGQVKRAWLEAREAGYTSWLLDSVFHRALVSGRRARSETRIGVGAVGYPQAAVELLSSRLGGLSGRRILVVGAGNAAESAVRYMCQKYEPSEVLIANRTLERAARLLSHCRDASIHPLDRVKRLLKGVDAAFIAVSGKPLSLSREDIDGVGAVADISIPPVVEGPFRGVYLFEDVKVVAEDNARRRLEESARVEDIIREEYGKLLRDLGLRSVEEYLGSVMRLSKELLSREVSYAARNIRRGLDPEEAVSRALMSYTKKVLRPLLAYFRSSADPQALRVLQGISELYEREYVRLRGGGG